MPGDKETAARTCPALLVPQLPRSRYIMGTLVVLVLCPWKCHLNSNVWLSAEPLLQVNAHAEASTDKQGRDLSCSDPRGGCCKIPSDPQRMCVLCPPTHARRTRPLSAPPAAASRLKTFFLLPVQNPSNNVLHH